VTSTPLTKLKMQTHLFNSDELIDP